MVFNIKKYFDTQPGREEFTRQFHVMCETQMPKSMCFCFDDVYLDSEWNVAAKKEDNDC